MMIIIFFCGKKKKKGNYKKNTEHDAKLTIFYDKMTKENLTNIPGLQNTYIKFKETGIYFDLLA